MSASTAGQAGALGGIRTPNLLVRSGAPQPLPRESSRSPATRPRSTPVGVYPIPLTYITAGQMGGQVCWDRLQSSEICRRGGQNGGQRESAGVWRTGKHPFQACAWTGSIGPGRAAGPYRPPVEIKKPGPQGAGEAALRIPRARSGRRWTTADQALPPPRFPAFPCCEWWESGGNRTAGHKAH